MPAAQREPIRLNMLKACRFSGQTSMTDFFSDLARAAANALPGGAFSSGL
jgi:hypothetical protein